ncbi:polysialyltransferase family glycosyltransferase [Roseivirga sp. 4D4]|uniref:polysialyltransferase family glycosyltransferase n=1 Tax=Roseivirga sp. 4D4 TaxID=1889784 RepID=UPI001112CD0C|nr:polysialyltransferase family glycosyltransferase [Roseivirga sp. 4D4]
MSKLKLLFNFGYSRSSWIYPIERLTDHFDITYIFYVDQRQEVSSNTHQKKVYWSEFESAQDLLDQIKPDKVVFMDLSSVVAIALNYVARKKGISTYILQHGFFNDYREYRQRQKLYLNQAIEKSKSLRKTEPQISSFSATGFLKKSIRKSDLFYFWKLIPFLILRNKFDERLAAKWVRFSARIPDKYICYTSVNAQYHRQLDNPKETKFHYIGNPELDKFLNLNLQEDNFQEYYLHIDQPLAENQYGEHLFSKVQMVNFYKKLNAFCKQEGLRLLIKLHPESYSGGWFPQDANIKYIRQHHDLPSLIAGAKGCSSFFSTLALPAMLYKPVVLFKVSPSIFLDHIKSLKMAWIHDFENGTLSSQDLHIQEGRHVDKFIEDYFYSLDGKSIDRLRVLMSA